MTDDNYTTPEAQAERIDQDTDAAALAHAHAVEPPEARVGQQKAFKAGVLWAMARYPGWFAEAIEISKHTAQNK